MRTTPTTQRIAAIFLLAFPSLASAECDATYSVNFAANYHNNVTVKCTVEDMDLITRVIHSVVELDSISSRLSREVPDFKFMFERFGEDVLVVNGDEYTPEPPDAEEIDKHLTPEDLMQELYYEDGTEAEDHTLSPPLPIDGASPPVEYAKPHEETDPEHRRAQLMDCSLMEQCTDMWCCQVCGFCWARRQRKLAAQESRPRPSSSSYLRSKRPTSTEEGREEDDQEQQKHDQRYLHRVQRHEERVSKELLKKFRYMMRKNTIPCLGNFWELKVFFKMVI